MSTSPYFYTDNSTAIDANGVAVGASASSVEALLEEIFLTPGSPGGELRTIKFLAKQNVFSQLFVETVSVVVDGNEVNVAGAVFDMTAQSALTAITLAVTATFTSSALILAGVSIAGAGITAGLYSAFVEPIVDDSVFDLLAGQDKVYLLDSSGGFEAGMVYDDGIPSTEVMAAHAMISHATANVINIH